MADKFPVTLSHPDVKGTTTAATKSSLRVLERRGWKPVKPPKPSPVPRSEPKPEPKNEQDI